MIRFFLMMMFLPLFVIAQKVDFSGVWMMKEKKSLNGPNYENGLPPIINIHQTQDFFIIEIRNSFAGRDTTFVDTINLNSNNASVKTLSKRTSRVALNWCESDSSWERITTLSSKQDPNTIEITVKESFKLFNSDNGLKLIKKYDGNDEPGGNIDFIMEGIYERVTSIGGILEKAKGRGINFYEPSSWEEVLEKARRERKMIFVDCYATWCLPCKKMDKEVYPLTIIGDSMNADFVSIKIQMDTLKKDNEQIQKMYPIARKFEVKYNINSLPTFLFLDSLGQLVHKEIGFLSAAQFLKTASEAKDSTTQLFTLFRKSQNDQLNFTRMATLALEFSNQSEGKLAQLTARRYFEKCLYLLSEDAFFSKENIDFFIRFLSVVRSSDKIFLAFLSNPRKYDSLFKMGDGYVKSIIESVITREEVAPFLKNVEINKTQPDWSFLEISIKRKYGSIYALKLLIDAKVSWYRKKGEWKPFCQNLIYQTNLMGKLENVNWYLLNSNAWAIFEHSNDKVQLKTALNWIQIAIKSQLLDTSVKDAPWVTLLDTYANLLYKLGRRREAITYYKEKIIDSGPVHVSFRETFDKMRRGIATWPTGNVSKE